MGWGGVGERKERLEKGTTTRGRSLNKLDLKGNGETAEEE